MANFNFDKQTESALNRFEKYYETGDFVIGFITDVHTGGNDHYKHCRYFFDAAKKFKTDLLINGGDIGLGLGENEKQAEELIEKTIESTKTNIPYIFVKGNHDCGEKPYSASELYGRLMPNDQKGLSLVKEGGYGVYEIDSQKLAVIFMNTSDFNAHSYFVSNKQISWLIKTLSNIKEGYRVIVVSHFCMDEIGFWNSSVNLYGFKLPKSIEASQRIIIDFARHNKSSITVEGETFQWDFTDKETTLLFELAGDSHFDNYTNKDGINIIVREGYGGILPEDVAKGGTHYKFSANEGIEDVKDCCFDIICVKPSNKTKVFRIGVGDEKADLEF